MYPEFNLEGSAEMLCVLGLAMDLACQRFEWSRFV